MTAPAIPNSGGLADVLNVLLDMGLVIDASVRVSLIGIEILAIDIKVVIASVDTYIRYLETAGFDLRRHGILAHELETQAAAAQKSRLKALRAGTKPEEDFLARNATGLAEDYEKLTMEIIGKLTEINQEVEAVS